MGRGNALIVMGADEAVTLNQLRELYPVRHSTPDPTPDPEPEPEPAKTAGPVAFNPFRREDDPSSDELRRLSADQLLQLDESEPGMIERLQSADAFDAASSTEYKQAQAARVQAEYDRRMSTDPEFVASELRGQARDELENRWDHASDAERQALAEDAGLSSDELSSMEANHEAAQREARLKEAGVRDGQAFEDFQSGKDALPSEPYQGPPPPDGTGGYGRPS